MGEKEKGGEGRGGDKTKKRKKKKEKEKKKKKKWERGVCLGGMYKMCWVQYKKKWNKLSFKNTKNTLSHTKFKRS